MPAIKPFVVDGLLVAVQPAIHQYFETALSQLPSKRCDKRCLNVVASWKQKTRLYTLTKGGFRNSQCITRLLQCARLTAVSPLMGCVRAHFIKRKNIQSPAYQNQGLRTSIPSTSKAGLGVSHETL